MATDRLKIYNGALILVGEGRLNISTGLTEDKESRFLLDEVWNDGGVKFCLEQAQWQFAMRSSRFDFNPAITPAFGYKRAFDKPTDWVLTSGVFQDEFFDTPQTEYADEADNWFSDQDELFVRYVSDDASFGFDFAKWPASFTDYVKTYFASRIVHRKPGSKERIEILFGPPGRSNRGLLHLNLLTAKNKSAMTQPTTFPSRGTWAAARHHGRNRSFRDGGNTGSLIG